ncbi:hypothetical protein EYF80_037809 [Liparis tanakae]|uniref:Uncharacterized protein n=1 Tax=Liparis tanakae TaxID=230148 RepID=A0A4Z2GGI8_9TELE|nr:hypothetical protein EYF80_037809 [Liparis tanakae]
MSEMSILLESVTFFRCGELAAGEHVRSIWGRQSSSQTNSSKMDRWLSRSMLEKKPLHCFSKFTKSYE